MTHTGWPAHLPVRNETIRMGHGSAPMKTAAPHVASGALLVLASKASLDAALAATGTASAAILLLKLSNHHGC
jgi:hypothetical protein